MAASATQTTPKPAKKKNKASAAAAAAASAAADRTASPAPSVSTAPPPDKSADGGPGNEDESPFIREIQKNIRNLVKKLGNTAKTDAVISENPGKSLDELVAAKIINSDQRTAIQKKPGLQAQLDQLQEQLGQHRTIDNEYRIRAKAEREELEKALAEKFEREKAAAVEAAQQRTAEDLNKAFRDLEEATENMVRAKEDAERMKEILQDTVEDQDQLVEQGYLLVSQFLRLAAARRNEEADPDAEENRALEGILLAIYSGDHTAVDTMKKLVAGSEDKTFSVHGLQLQTTFAQVKAAAAEYKVVFPECYAETEPALFSTEPEGPPAHIQAEPSGGPADMAETAVSFATYAKGHGPDAGLNGFPTNMGADSLIANMAAESQWDNTVVGPSISQGWDMVSPIDVGAAAAAASAPDPVAAPAPAPAPSFDIAAAHPPPASGSWADDNPDAGFGQVDANEGFHHVQQRRGRGDSGWRGGGGGSGSFRGGRGGESRGRGGFRGEYRGGRGRGRGGSRGGGDSGFPPRGGQPRRWEDSSS